MYYPCSSAFIFAYAKCWFSHDATHFFFKFLLWSLMRLKLWYGSSPFSLIFSLLLKEISFNFIYIKIYVVGAH